MLTLQPTISFIFCWEWEREVRFQACELSDSKFSIKKEFRACISDLKLFSHIFAALPPSHPLSFFYKKQASEGRPNPERIGRKEKQQMYSSYKQPLFLGIYGLHHFNSWIYVPLSAVDLLKWHLFSDFYEPQTLDVYAYFEQKVRINKLRQSSSEISQLPHSGCISEQQLQGFVGGGRCGFSKGSMKGAGYTDFPSGFSSRAG